MSSGDVDDAQPPHAEAEILIYEVSGIVRTAMDLNVTLRGYDRWLHRTSTTAVPACYAAQIVLP